MDTTHTAHKKIAGQVAERLSHLREHDPELHELITIYVTSLRFESARHRARARQMQERLEALAVDSREVA